MSKLFGGKNDKSRDIRDIVASLQEGTSAICNESVSGASMSAIQVREMADTIARTMNEHYSRLFDNAPQFEGMLQEDAESAAQMFMNNMNEWNSGSMNESAVMPSLVTLTASIATTMRTPYEAVLHRLFDTRTLEKQVVEIEEVIPTVKAPADTHEEDLIDALSPNAEIPFVDKTEIEVETLTKGLVPGTGCNNLFVFDAGTDPLFRVNRDVRVAKIEATIDGEVIDAKNISMAKRATP